MFSALNLILVTIALSVVMLLVLLSLVRSGIAGVREWIAANSLSVVALALFSGRGVVPDIFSIELANAFMLTTSALILTGFCRHFSRMVPAKALTVGGALVFAIIAAFHYGFDSIALRTVVVSVFHGACCLAMGITILQAPRTSRPRYPYLFTAGAALALALGHAVRSIVYLFKVDAAVTYFEPSAWNLFFLSVGTLALPSLTLGAVMIVHDAILAKAEHAANHDHLTGAWSRRAFFDIAERERARTLRTGRKLSLLLFDVDHFKEINDTYGHAHGDQVLKDIVLRTESVIRGIDYCGRVGGDEFAVLLPEVEDHAATEIAERLRCFVKRPESAAQSDAVATSNAAYSISVGTASLSAGESIVELIRRADTALYAAKAGGRNAVVNAQQPPTFTARIGSGNDASEL